MATPEQQKLIDHWARLDRIPAAFVVTERDKLVQLLEENGMRSISAVQEQLAQAKLFEDPTPQRRFLSLLGKVLGADAAESISARNLMLAFARRGDARKGLGFQMLGEILVYGPSGCAVEARINSPAIRRAYDTYGRAGEAPQCLPDLPCLKTENPKPELGADVPPVPVERLQKPLNVTRQVTQKKVTAKAQPLLPAAVVNRAFVAGSLIAVTWLFANHFLPDTVQDLSHRPVQSQKAPELRGLMPKIK